MKVNAVIAEYNPFHNGHKYHLDASVQKTSADYTIIVMSGNFVQRGAPAIAEKYLRARAALLNGADLVIELPVFYAASSAEYFATGAVTLIDKLGVVDALCFGSECGEISVLNRIAQILLNEPEEYRAYLKNYMRLGHSYPISRTNALIQYDPSLSDWRNVLSTPNNILGIEYIKALSRRKSSIIPTTTIRAGSDYHDIRMGKNQSSANAIRVALSSGQDMDFLHGQMPDSAFEILKKGLSEIPMMISDDFSESLYYKLLNEKNTGYTKYFDVSPSLSDRILKHIYEYKSFSEFCNILKSKDMTYTRISRCLLHILLDMTNESFEECKALGYTPYARVLGFKNASSPLLSSIKKNSEIPLITKLADAKAVLSDGAFRMLENELRMNNIYLSAAALKSGTNLKNELSTPIVIV
ncbi:MAG: nucleotidyltransferase [Lachnospiraceae bacterium]|nr:nucleotidyltransferase [Lachnospiraceae bacterium]